MLSSVIGLLGEEQLHHILLRVSFVFPVASFPPNSTLRSVKTEINFLLIILFRLCQSSDAWSYKSVSNQFHMSGITIHTLND